MTNRERVLASLHHRQPDRTPYCIGFTQKAYTQMADYYGDASFGEKLGNCFTIVKTAPPDAWQEIKPDLWEDQFGVQWDRHIDKDIGNVANRLITPETIDDFIFPDPHDPSRYTDYPKTEAEKGDRFIIAEIGFSLFERAWTLTGMENLLTAMMCEPDYVHKLFERIVEFNLAIVDDACSYPIDCFYFGDDWGCQRGLIMGYDVWKEFIGPCAQRMYQAVKECGKYVLIHSCGKVDELFPDLIAYGLDIFNPFQPEVIDVFDAKRRYGDRLCFFGGISTQRILPYATPNEVREHVKRLVDEVGKNGGYFASPAHAIPPDAKPENIDAMIDVLRNQ